MSREKRWISAHMCPKCGLIIDLANIDFKAITTGMLTCPRCDWSGPIGIEIVDADR